MICELVHSMTIILCKFDIFLKGSWPIKFFNVIFKSSHLFFILAQISTKKSIEKKIKNCWRLKIVGKHCFIELHIFFATIKILVKTKAH